MDNPTLTCTTCGSPTTWTAPPGFAPRGVEVTCRACAGRRVPVMGPPTLAEREAALLARIAALEQLLTDCLMAFDPDTKATPQDLPRLITHVCTRYAEVQCGTVPELIQERDEWRTRAQAAEDLLADIGALARGEMAGDARVGPAPAVATWDAVRAALAERGVEVTRG